MKHLSKFRMLGIVGAALLGVALYLTWQRLTWGPLFVLLAVGVIDLILVIAKQHTISQWIHRLFPKWVDVSILTGLLVYTWFVFGPEGFLVLLMGTILGHLFLD